ncbi:predicted protein [Histoplasma mississippiense (nom. inval.)]|uniref:predicted protein n=1 Tax=Ajellomyces capsulatus (strain NAm1 / WU24) TaxID=2059318 RepID=UPI000157CB2E|nr:predicted protein [Histoplasma mississippiense (nom. inval.)]EDN09554.1 predicted protein [Histoplasma mississippiense (nom. inval.)]
MIKSSNRSWGPDDSWMAFALFPLICRTVAMIRVFGLRLSPSRDDQALSQKLLLVGRVFYALLFWSHEHLHHPCRKGMADLLTMGTLNIATDLALILFPIPMLWRMTSLDFQARNIGCCNYGYAAASYIESIGGSVNTFSMGIH